MSSGKISYRYWCVKGLGAGGRIALHLANVEFDDNIVTDFKQWFGPDTEEVSKVKPLVNLPHLKTADGEVIVQSGAVLRYIARNYKLYGATDKDMSRVDQVLEVIVDLRKELYKLGDSKEEEFEEAKKKFAEETITYFFSGLDKFRTLNGSKYIAADSLTVADAVTIDSMFACAAAYESDVATVFAAFPALVAYHADFIELPQWKSYTATAMGDAKTPINGPGSRFSAMVMPAETA